MRQIIRYLFFGGCTTAVNLGVFAVLRITGIADTRTANLLSILTAVIFAFFVNKYFVFESGNHDRGTVLKEFLNFTGMRFFTMVLEFFGVDILIHFGQVPDFMSKFIIQFVVIITNYMISKFWVFKDSKISGGVRNV